MMGGGGGHPHILDNNDFSQNSKVVNLSQVEPRLSILWLLLNGFTE